MSEEDFSDPLGAASFNNSDDNVKTLLSVDDVEDYDKLKPEGSKSVVSVVLTPSLEDVKKKMEFQQTKESFFEALFAPSIPRSKAKDKKRESDHASTKEEKLEQDISDQWMDMKTGEDVLFPDDLLGATEDKVEGTSDGPAAGEGTHKVPPEAVDDFDEVENTLNPELEKFLVEKYEEPVRDRMAKFAGMFQSGAGDWLESIQERATFAGLDGSSNHRSLCWKLFLRVLNPEEPVESWVQEHERFHEKYGKLVEEHFVDPKEEEEHVKAKDFGVFNPLSQADDSPWAKYFENMELQRVIKTDLTRTFPEIGWYQQDDIQCIMMRVLFIYAKLYPKLAYRQGMHELLAVIMGVLHKSCLKPSEAENDINSEERAYFSLFNDDYLESDSFWMFERLMELVGPWYVSERGQRNPGGNALGNLLGEEKRTIDDRSPVISKARYIQNVLLKGKDEEIYKNLTEMSVEPQLYALRWVRMLFTRELNLLYIPRTWDLLFGYKYPLISVDSLAIALLLEMRDSLICDDYSTVLHALLHFPPVDDIEALLLRAMRVQDNAYVTRVLPTVVFSGANSAKRRNAEGGKDKAEPHASGLTGVQPDPPKRLHPASGNLALGNGHVKPSPAGIRRQPATASSIFGNKEREDELEQLCDEQATELHNLRLEMKKAEETNVHMAQRIDRIIFAMQQSVTGNDTGNTDEESILLSLAELKQIRDVLNGSLPIDMFPS